MKDHKTYTTEEKKVDALRYESMRDKALAMAFTLRQIDRELRIAAQCEGDYLGGYKPEDLLPKLCKIMYAAEGYHEEDEMLTKRELARKYPNKETPPEHIVLTETKKTEGEAK